MLLIIPSLDLLTHLVVLIFSLVFKRVSYAKWTHSGDMKSPINIIPMTAVKLILQFVVTTALIRHAGKSPFIKYFRSNHYLFVLSR